MKHPTLSISPPSKNYRNTTTSPSGAKALYQRNLHWCFQPEMKNIAFISDSLYMSHMVFSKVEKTVRQHYPDLKLIWLSQRELDLEQLLDTVSSYDKSTGLLYFSWHKPQQMPSHSFLADNIGKTLTGFANSLFHAKRLTPTGRLLRWRLLRQRKWLCNRLYENHRRNKRRQTGIRHPTRCRTIDSWKLL